MKQTVSLAWVQWLASDGKGSVNCIFHECGLYSTVINEVDEVVLLSSKWKRQTLCYVLCFVSPITCIKGAFFFTFPFQHNGLDATTYIYHLGLQGSLNKAFLSVSIQLNWYFLFGWHCARSSQADIPICPLLP